MVNFSDKINKKRLELDSEEKKYRSRAYRKEQEEEKEKEKKKQSGSTSKDEKIKELTEKRKEDRQRLKEEKMKQIYEYYLDNPDLSFRKLGEKFDLDPKTAKRYIEEMKDSDSQQESDESLLPKTKEESSSTLPSED